MFYILFIFFLTVIAHQNNSSDDYNSNNNRRIMHDPRRHVGTELCVHIVHNHELTNVKCHRHCEKCTGRMTLLCMECQKSVYGCRNIMFSLLFNIKDV